MTTLFLGFHYFPDLISGGVLFDIPTVPWRSRDWKYWWGPTAAPFFRRRFWVLNLVHRELRGLLRHELAGRTGELVLLGAETSPGLVSGDVRETGARNP